MKEYSSSPELNPIEYVWDDLERSIPQNNLRLKILLKLKAVLMVEWAINIYCTFIYLINTLKTLFKASIAVLCGHT